MSNPIVYQVRAVEGANERVVHAYETPQAAQEAIKMMQSKTGKWYKVVPVENDPSQFWGINFPPAPKSKQKKAEG
jgi:hypothetical protein